MPMYEERNGLGIPTGKIIPEQTSTRIVPYIVEVDPIEATETGYGRVCPICNRRSGSYVCDGFPTHQASSIIPATKEES